MIIKKSILPEGTAQVRYWTELYKLLPRKKKFLRDNCVPRYGIEYFVWSAYTRHFYLRTLREESNMEDIKALVVRGWVFLYPNEEHKAEILEEVKSSGLSYYKLNLVRLLVWDLEDHLTYGDKGASGWQSKKMAIEEKLFELTGGTNF